MIETSGEGTTHVEIQQRRQKTSILFDFLVVDCRSFWRRYDETINSSQRELQEEREEEQLLQKICYCCVTDFLESTLFFRKSEHPWRCWCFYQRRSSTGDTLDAKEILGMKHFPVVVTDFSVSIYVFARVVFLSKVTYNCKPRRLGRRGTTRPPSLSDVKNRLTNLKHDTMRHYDETWHTCLLQTQLKVRIIMMISAANFILYFGLSETESDKVVNQCQT